LYWTYTPHIPISKLHVKTLLYKYIFCGTLPSDPPNFIKNLICIRYNFFFFNFFIFYCKSTVKAWWMEWYTLYKVVQDRVVYKISRFPQLYSRGWPTKLKIYQNSINLCYYFVKRLPWVYILMTFFLPEPSPSSLKILNGFVHLLPPMHPLVKLPNALC
jgi:hypothetical protein